MSSSILDDLGQEVTGIVAPVSICMFLTVLLVRILNPDGVSNPSAVAIAQTFYKEQVHLLVHDCMNSDSMKCSPGIQRVM